MKTILLACLLSLTSARQVALKDFTFGFCEETTPKPLDIEVATIEPFPIPLVTGTVLDVNVLFQLNEICPVGTTVKMDMKLTGLIEVPIPCLESYRVTSLPDFLDFISRPVACSRVRH